MRSKLILIFAIGLGIAACSALQPPDAGGPRVNAPVYPIVLPAETARLQEALVLWQRLAPSTTAAPQGNLGLHPYTATIEGLPPNTNLLLPKLGENPTMSEEETREALRRFIAEWQSLIGADPNQLSLLDRTDQPDGTKLALYEQQPFRFPLRGSYGKLRIRFMPDRRVVDLSSSCIPNADRLQASLASITPQLSWEDAQSRVINMNSAGFTITAANKPDVRELVVFAKDPATGTGPLELHLAWEIAVINGPFKLVYLDAVKGDLLATV
ncbi:MAG TPA: hypothetical protein VIV66_05620 [Pyrinomonadaceae bacterium]